MSKIQGFNLFIQNALKYGFSLFGLPKTNQTYYEEDGDDGFYKKGYPISGPRFIDNGDNTITDKATGLMWIKRPSLLGVGWAVPPADPTMDQWSAVEACEALNYAGYSDWRLPNINELSSLFNFDRVYPVSYLDFFPELTTDYWWTSTIYMGWTGAGYITDFDNGFSTFGFLGSLRYVLPVRGGA